MSADQDPVYEALRQAIVEGDLDPDARLVEQALAEQLGTSRTPIREALRRLDAEGLVVLARNRGAQVRSFDPAEVADVYELRGRLEAYAAELAAVRRTEEDLDALHRAAAAFEAAVARAGDRPPPLPRAASRALNATNRAFHDAVAAAAHHPRLAATLRGAVDTPLVFRALRGFGPAERARSALFHRLVVEAIAAGADRRAGRLMAEHIAQGLDQLRT